MGDYLLPFALASEYHRLSPAQQSRVTHILCDDGEWTEAQIAEAVAEWIGPAPASSDLETHIQDDWSKL